MNKFILAGVVGGILLVGAIVSYAEKWDKSNFTDISIESAFYEADSIKLQGKTISLTEKFILTSYGVKSSATNLSKYQACKQNLDKKGNPVQYQHDYQIENGKIRVMAIRYYNKDNEILCTDKDMGKDVNKSWIKIRRNSGTEQIYYDMVTKYKIVVPN